MLACVLRLKCAAVVRRRFYTGDYIVIEATGVHAHRRTQAIHATPGEIESIIAMAETREARGTCSVCAHSVVLSTTHVIGTHEIGAIAKELVGEHSAFRNNQRLRDTLQKVPGANKILVKNDFISARDGV